jgi:hypothetical protein
VSLAPRHNDLIDEVEDLRRRVRRLETRTRTATITKTFVVVGQIDPDLYIPPIFVAPDPEDVGDQGLGLRGLFAHLRAGTVDYALYCTPVVGAGFAYGAEFFVASGHLDAGTAPNHNDTSEDRRVAELSSGARFRLALPGAAFASDLSVSLIFDHTPR